ncbi:hypothetical protein [Salsuginibacillus kocurii]|nr:hypothetical protein [Salsuginibacillus kocurii]
MDNTSPDHHVMEYLLYLEDRIKQLEEHQHEDTVGLLKWIYSYQLSDKE